MFIWILMTRSFLIGNPPSNEGRLYLRLHRCRFKLSHKFNLSSPPYLVIERMIRICNRFYRDFPLRHFNLVKNMLVFPTPRLTSDWTQSVKSLSIIIKTLVADTQIYSVQALNDAGRIRFDFDFLETTHDVISCPGHAGCQRRAMWRFGEALQMTRRYRWGFIVDHIIQKMSAVMLRLSLN